MDSLTDQHRYGLDACSTESVGRGYMPQAATQAKLHVPNNVHVAEQLSKLAYGVDNGECHVPDWAVFNKDHRHKYQSYQRYKKATHMWEEF